jgi:hypothetical protein
MAIGAGRLRSLLDLANDLKAGAVTALIVVGTQGVLGQGKGPLAALPLDRLQALVAIGTHKDGVTAAAPRAARRLTEATAPSPTSWACPACCRGRPRATRRRAGRSCRTWRVPGATMDFTEAKADRRGPEAAVHEKAINGPMLLCNPLANQEWCPGINYGTVGSQRQRDRQDPVHGANRCRSHRS